MPVGLYPAWTRHSAGVHRALNLRATNWKFCRRAESMLQQPLYPIRYAIATAHIGLNQSVDHESR